MIEGITILTKGGLVLWNYSFYPLRGNPVNQLIKNVFLEERVSEKSFSHDNYTLEWTFANDFDLIFVVCTIRWEFMIAGYLSKIDPSLLCF